MSEALVDFHIALRSEIEITAPVSAVWQRLEQPRDWKPSIVSIERIDGQPGEEGETLRLCQRRGEETAYLIMRTLGVQPGRWRVQTLTTEDRPDADGFVIYALEPTTTGTRLVCDFVARCLADARAIGGATIAEFARNVSAATSQKLDADHLLLKMLVERRA
jgi:hypothetical protein